MTDIDWRKYHKFMPYEGWCGVTTISMILSACKIKKSIYEVALYTWKWWYGTPYILFVAYLEKFFSTVNFKTGATIADISRHMKQGHIVILNWYDEDDGHYAIVSTYEKGWLTIVDSSRERDWQYALSTKELKKVWFDNLTDSLWHENLLIWIDPKSKRKIK